MKKALLNMRDMGYCIKEGVKMKTRSILKIAIICTVAFSLYAKGNVYAETPDAYWDDVYNQEGPVWEQKGRHPRHRRGQTDGQIDKHTLIALVFESLPEEQREELIRLRQTDPEKFKEMIEPKLRQQGEYLKNLRETDPQTFRAVLGEVRQRARKKHMMKLFVFESLPPAEKQDLIKLKESNPEKSREVIKGKLHRQGKQLHKLKEENPEKFKEIQERIKKKAKEDHTIRTIVFETLSDREKQALTKLKKKNPARFKKVLERKMREKGEYLKELKEDDPEEFKEITQKARQKLVRRAERLREKDPERFKKMMTHGGQMRRKKLHKLCEDNPEKCEEIKERRVERIKKMLAELKVEDSESYQAIKKWMRR